MDIQKWLSDYLAPQKPNPAQQDPGQYLLDQWHQTPEAQMAASLQGQPQQRPSRPAEPYQSHGFSMSPLPMGDAAIGNQLFQGIDTMNNLGNTISQGFGMANALSSANLANRIPLDVERERTNRFQMALPLIQGMMGGGGGRMQGFTTPFGQSAKLA